MSSECECSPGKRDTRNPRKSIEAGIGSGYSLEAKFKTGCCFDANLALRGYHLGAFSFALNPARPFSTKSEPPVFSEVGKILSDTQRGSGAESAEFVEIKDPNGADFEPFFQIYEEALPESERKSRAQVAEIVTREDYQVIVMKSGGQVLSFLIVFVSLDQEVALLEYMATARQARNRGLGAEMFKKAAEIAGSRPLLVEVDSEREDSPDHEIRKRRKSFYFRAGCQQIEGLHYLMPRVDGSDPPAMDLLYYWKERSTPPSKELIRRWIETVYTGVYQRPTDDPAIEWMMNSLTQQRANQA